jgi:RimJ/RimL family protein N-acetyltransferase
MAFPERLETARLLLEKPRRDDLAELVEVIGDPRVPEEQFPARFRTPELTESLLVRAIEHWDERGFGPWLADDDTLVGRVGLMSSTYEGRDCVEAKWFIGPDHWRRGYAVEAAKAAIDAGFEQLELDEILAWTMTTNLGSQAVMRRLGFSELGPLDRAGLPHVAYRVTRP